MSDVLKVTIYAPLLAQSVDAAADIFRQLMYIIAIGTTISIIGFVVHRRMKRRWNDPAESETFTLTELRHLRDQGMMSDQEYERARGAIVAKGLALLGDTATVHTDDSAPSSPTGEPDAHTMSKGSEESLSEPGVSNDATQRETDANDESNCGFPGGPFGEESESPKEPPSNDTENRNT